MDIAWRILDVCQQHQAKPSVVTINAIMGAVLRSHTMPDSDKMEAALKLVDKIHAHGMQVGLNSLLSVYVCVTVTGLVAKRKIHCVDVVCA